MDFKVYQVTYAGDLRPRGQQLFDYLRGLDKIRGEHGLHYCITQEVDFDENIITGCISEEYLPNINSVDEEKVSYVPEVDPYLHTFFAFDLQEKRILLQNRDYPANNLDKHQTRTRLFTTIKQGFEGIYNAEFDYVDTYRETNDEDFIAVFNEYRISFMRVKLFQQGRMLREGATIFETENESLNPNWVEGWNSDASGMHEIILKAPGRGGDGDLRQSPIALSLINLPVKEIVELNYWNEDEISTSMSRTDSRRFRVEGVDLHTQPITGIAEISRAVYQRRDELRTFRLVADLE